MLCDRVQKKKINFESTAFLNYERGTSREGNSNENKTKHKQTNTSQLLRSVTLL